MRLQEQALKTQTGENFSIYSIIFIAITAFDTKLAKPEIRDEKQTDAYKVLKPQPESVHISATKNLREKLLVCDPLMNGSNYSTCRLQRTVASMKHISPNMQFNEGGLLNLNIECSAGLFLNKFNRIQKRF